MHYIAPHNNPTVWTDDTQNHLGTPHKAKAKSNNAPPHNFKSLSRILGNGTSNHTKSHIRKPCTVFDPYSPGYAFASRGTIHQDMRAQVVWVPSSLIVKHASPWRIYFMYTTSSETMIFRLPSDRNSYQNETTTKKSLMFEHKGSVQHSKWNAPTREAITKQISLLLTYFQLITMIRNCQKCFILHSAWRSIRVPAVFLN